MEVTEYALPIRDLVSKAHSISLFLPANPSLDLLAAGLAWYDLLKRREKTLQIAAESLNPERYPQKLPGLNEVRVPLPQPQMQIKVDLRPARVSRVNYQTQNETLIFYLVPRGKPLSPEQVTVEQSEILTDLIFTFGFANDQKLSAYAQNTLVNVDVNPENTRFGKINLVDQSVSGLSELSARLFSDLNWPLEGNVATLLLAGIFSATHRFSRRTTAKTFEVATLLTKAGADVTLVNELVGLKSE